MIWCLLYMNIAEWGLEIRYLIEQQVDFQPLGCLKVVSAKHDRRLKIFDEQSNAILELHSVFARHVAWCWLWAVHLDHCLAVPRIFLSRIDVSKRSRDIVIIDEYVRECLQLHLVCNERLRMARYLGPCHKPGGCQRCTRDCRQHCNSPSEISDAIFGLHTVGITEKDHNHSTLEAAPLRWLPKVAI